MSYENQRQSLKRRTMSYKKQHLSVQHGSVSMEQGNVSIEQGNVSPKHQHETVNQQHETLMRGEEPMQHDNEQVTRRDARPDVAHEWVELGNLSHDHRDVHVERGQGGVYAGDVSVESQYMATNDACLPTHDQSRRADDQCLTAEDQCLSADGQSRRAHAPSRTTEGQARAPPGSPRSVEHLDERFEALTRYADTRFGWREGRDAPVQHSLIASTHSQGGCMQLTQQKVQDTGHRVQTFLDTQGAAIGTTVPAPLRAQLDTAVAQVGQAQVDQETCTQAVLAETAKQDAIRKEVSADFLIPIGRIVRRAFSTSPDFQALIVPARLTRKGDFLGKVTAATAAAGPHAQDLIDRGMPADFIAQMQAAVTQLTASAETRGKLVGLKQQTVKTMKESTKSIRDAVHIIDGNMRRALKKNQPLLTNWVATKRIQATVVTPLPGGDLNATPSAVPTPAPVVPATVTTAPVTTVPAKPAV